LSGSLAKYPAVFSGLMVSMIHVGEESGNVEGVLGQLNIQLEREHDLRSKITGALMYPAVIVAAMIGIGILMLMFVVPKLAETFADLGAELPLPTRVVIALGTFMLEKWYLAFGGMAVAGVGLCRLSKTEPGKRAVGNIMLRLPVISGIVRKMNAAFTVRTLSSLISAGVSLVQSLEITAGVLGNMRFKRALLMSAEKVQKGTELSVALAEHANVYPLTVVQMVEVGEETGQTSEVLAKLADFYEEEVSALTKNLTSIIEPILMLIIGGVVGFFAISMIQPMYSMLSAF
ncbi:MAG: type II secretion system F family protein, partial [Candidatus Wildermuthbacteria bacterium]|nr:type II secretion system F family protein [Candidatus Wildermuthbacteria bacterium]